MTQDAQKKDFSNGVKDTPGTVPKARVLLLDDDKFLVGMYGMKFSANGFQVQTCLSVPEALQALRGGFSADAIVFDLVMPDQDGFAFLETLRSEHLAPSAVRIALTNQSDDTEKSKAEALGVDRYIIKASMIPSEVVNVVSEEVAKRKSA